MVEGQYAHDNFSGLPAEPRRVLDGICREIKMSHHGASGHAGCTAGILENCDIFERRDRRKFYRAGVFEGIREGVKALRVFSDQIQDLL